MGQLVLQSGHLFQNTMRIGVDPEHAPALESGESRRTVTDYALMQVGNGGFSALWACLRFGGAGLMEYYVGKSPSDACVVVLRSHGV